jgi:transcriptional regulator with XRE-family HTH domain
MEARRRESAIAECLRVELARRQMTQQELADRLGYTQTAVSYWAAGKRQPDLDDLCRLADEFGVTTDYLLGRAGSCPI